MLKRSNTNKNKFMYVFLILSVITLLFIIFHKKYGNEPMLQDFQTDSLIPLPLPLSNASSIKSKKLSNKEENSDVVDTTMGNQADNYYLNSTKSHLTTPSSITLPASTRSAATSSPLQSSTMSANNSTSRPSSTMSTVTPTAVANNDQKMEEINVEIANFSTTGVRVSDLYESGHSDPNSDLCGPGAGKDINLLILITSDPKHLDYRLAIRETWGNSSGRPDVAMAFFLGVTQDQSIESSLKNESDLYGDIVRGRFIDSINNLTLKTILLLEWADKHCSRAKFILKTEDNVFINVPTFLSFIEQNRSQEDQRVIFGSVLHNVQPDRNDTSAWHLSPQDYFPPEFPHFTSGSAYLMTRSVVHELYATALQQMYLKLEDIFITGIVADLLNITLVNVTDFETSCPCNNFTRCKIEKTFIINDVPSTVQSELWEKSIDTNVEC